MLFLLPIENHLPFGSEASMLAASLAVQLLRGRNKKAPTILMRRVSNQAIELKDKKLKNKNVSVENCFIYKVLKRLYG